MKYYKVTAKCGHVGRNNYIEIDFPSCANTAKEAAQKILKHSKVKRQLKNAITCIEELTFDDYQVLSIKYNNDNYVRAHYSREYDLSNYEVKKLTKTTWKKSFESRYERIMYILKKNKIKENSTYELMYC